MNRRNSLILELVFIAVVSSIAAAQTNADVERLMEEALKTSPIEQNLRHLTDEIGGRVPGTPAMDKAVAWGVAAFKAAGADSVHTEEFKMPASWAEGEHRGSRFGHWNVARSQSGGGGLRWSSSCARFRLPGLRR